jgi:hypothetical protein
MECFLSKSRRPRGARFDVGTLLPEDPDFTDLWKLKPLVSWFKKELKALV